MSDRSHTMLAQVSGGFDGSRALVIGDLMLDRHLWGSVGRISPEAPVPVVHFQRRTETPGGAGNVAANLTGLGMTVTIVGCVGDDASADVLARGLHAAGIDRVELLRCTDRPTTTKTRIIGSHQQMLRLDDETTAPFDHATTAGLCERVDRAFDDAVDVVLISDYAKGVVDPILAKHVIEGAARRGVPVIVDPKGLDFTRYRGATTVTPNRSELAGAFGLSDGDIDGMVEGGAALCRELGLAFLTLTRSEQGISLIRPDGAVTTVPAEASDVFDVSGAGDTVAAVLAAGLAVGMDPVESIRLANVAAGIVVHRVGTVPIHRDDLLDELRERAGLLHSGKLMSRQDASERCDQWRSRGERVVFTNGCFDLVHAGHVTYLQRARREGNRLVLGLNSDDSVRRLKGESRPLVAEADRACVLAGLECIDAVVIFDEDTPLELIRALRPDVLVKGSDYELSEVVGAEDVQSWGGRVVLAPLVPGRSTSGIIERILEDA